MDRIVCGEALWITCGTWVEIWSGAIGAFVAAVLGGLVALWVVRLTNRQQRRIASDARELAAIADLVAATDAMQKKYRDGPDTVQDLLLQAKAAAVRWQMETKHHSLGSEITRWPYLLGVLSVQAAHHHAAEGEAGPSLPVLFDAQHILQSACIEWPKASSMRRSYLVAALEAKRLEVDPPKTEESEPEPDKPGS